LGLHYSLFKKDLDSILGQTEELWKELRRKKIFLTGGTGFFGVWLLESFAYVNQELSLDAQLTVLTRNRESLQSRLPHLFGLAGIHFHSGDVRSFEFPEGEFAYVVHAATSSGIESLEILPFDLFTTMIDGTRRVLELARKKKIEKFLFVSSGAVYGQQPSLLSHISEDYPGGPNPLDPKATYGECKRLAEHLVFLSGQRDDFQTVFARPFALVGPYLPLKAGFALGNFLENALQKQPIQVAGDGTPFRSYLYAADLVQWLWSILLKGASGRAYNVGSEKEVSILQLAHLIAENCWPSVKLPVHRAQTPISGVAPARYVPLTQRAQSELSLKENYSLIDSIENTFRWYREK
jgi:dTDP-glucose 4,6-dehydratase